MGSAELSLGFCMERSSATKLVDEGMGFLSRGGRWWGSALVSIGGEGGGEGLASIWLGCSAMIVVEKGSVPGAITHTRTINETELQLQHKKAQGGEEKQAGKHGFR